MQAERRGKNSPFHFNKIDKKKSTKSTKSGGNELDPQGAQLNSHTTVLDSTHSHTIYSTQLTYHIHIPHTTRLDSTTKQRLELAHADPLRHTRSAKPTCPSHGHTLHGC